MIKHILRSAGVRCALVSLFGLLAMLALVGCFGSPRASKAEDEAAKRFEPEAGSSVVCVYRNTMVAAAQTFRLYMDKNLVGDSKNQSFFRVVIPPGAHTLTVTNVRNVKLKEMSITTDADKLYYVELQIGASPISGKPRFALVDEQKAKPTIQRCSLLRAGTTAMERISRSGARTLR